MLNEQHFSTFSIANTLAKYDIEIDDVATKNIVNDSRFVEQSLKQRKAVEHR